MKIHLFDVIIDNRLQIIIIKIINKLPAYNNILISENLLQCLPPLLLEVFIKNVAASDVTMVTD